MKVSIVALLAIIGFTNAYLQEEVQVNTAYGYLVKYGVPEAERIRKYEQSRIVGGSVASLGQYPYQAGLIISLQGDNRQSVCGGSLVSSDRVVTAAHCWSDGVNQASQFEVILGSAQIFSGGVRVTTSDVVVHPNWLPQIIRNDVAIIKLPSSVPLSDTISPIALPSGSMLSEDFAGEVGVASGFGLTSDNMQGIPVDQTLHHVNLNIITNSVCSFAFPLIIQDSNICTSGVGGTSTCRGDSGGPLAVTRDGERVLVGITSFGSALGCEVGFPAAFARVTSYMDFFNEHM